MFGVSGLEMWRHRFNLPTPLLFFVVRARIRKVCCNDPVLVLGKLFHRRQDFFLIKSQAKKRGESPGIDHRKGMKKLDVPQEYPACGMIISLSIFTSFQVSRLKDSAVSQQMPNPYPANISLLLLSSPRTRNHTLHSNATPPPSRLPARPSLGAEQK